jgi:hypothetical protein
MKTIQLTKKQIQVLKECVLVELGYIIPVTASTGELKVILQLLESLKFEEPNAQKASSELS